MQAKALSEACLAARAACEGRDDLLGAVALGAAIARYADWHGGALSDDAFARRLRAMADALAPVAPAPAPVAAPPAEKKKKKRKRNRDDETPEERKARKLRKKAKKAKKKAAE